MQVTQNGTAQVNETDWCEGLYPKPLSSDLFAIVAGLVFFGLAALMFVNTLYVYRTWRMRNKKGRKRNKSSDRVSVVLVFMGLASFAGAVDAGSMG